MTEAKDGEGSVAKRMCRFPDNNKQMTNLNFKIAIRDANQLIFLATKPNLIFSWTPMKFLITPFLK
ncbi:MAG: hypothetical protein DRG71_06575 [Deltaproteobacteria bacterium]|nr:MAG: hypothetical protein DRG71_06575 [Deltaproteobacteria bacterium]